MFEHGGCNVASRRAGPGLAEREGLGRKTVLSRGEEKAWDGPGDWQREKLWGQ